VVRNLGEWGYQYVYRDEFDVVIEWSPKFLLIQRVAGFIRIMFGYDILVTFFNGSFFRYWLLSLAELVIFKLAGVRIIAVCYGSDVIQFDFPPPRFDWINHLLKDYPPANVAKHTAMVRGNIERITEASDFIVAGDHSLSPFLTRYDLNFKYFPIDCDSWVPLTETENEIPVIVHAPNHRNVKGTDLILAACDKLQRDGYKFELQIVEGIPRNEVRQIYRNADILVEELRMGASGLNGLECLALGKVVATYLNEEQLQDPAFDVPIVNINPENIEPVLRALVSVKTLRLRLGRAGRRAVERYHSFGAVGEVWDRIYRHLWFGAPLKLSETVIFDCSRRSRSLQEDPTEVGFWPVDVGDIMPQVRDAICTPPRIWARPGSSVHRRAAPIDPRETT